MNSKTVMLALGSLGLIPFAAGAALISAGTRTLDLGIGAGINPGFLFASYSAIILSFLGGVLWGRSLGLDAAGPGRNLLLLSNGIALLAWFGLLAGPDYFTLTLLALMLGYVVVLSAEQRLAEYVDYELLAPYMRMRFFLTNIVLAAHLVALAFG